MSMMPIMTIKGITKKFPGVMALDGVDMQIKPGGIIGLLGPNTAGKTTLLKTIAGLLRQDAGEITYPNGAKCVEVKGTVAFLPDNLVFPAWMRVKDAFAYYKDMYPDYSDDNAGKLVEFLELPYRENKSIRSMSKGMQERLALAVTFSRKTSLYLLDEPLGGIDPVGKSKILETILTTPPENSTILLSTHLIKDVETVLDSFFMISKGRIVREGDCETLREIEGKTVEQLYLEVFGT